MEIVVTLCPKAGAYFGIEVRHVPLADDGSMQPDLAQFEKAIDSNTIMVSVNIKAKAIRISP